MDSQQTASPGPHTGLHTGLQTGPKPDSEPTPGLISPLVIADRMITLAQDADRSGDQDTASRLMSLMLAMLDRTAAGAGRARR
ncbi:MAG: hypothetical protein ACRYGM_27330 [Janthinobacterium lividum]